MQDAASVVTKPMIYFALLRPEGPLESPLTARRQVENESMTTELRIRIVNFW